MHIINIFLIACKILALIAFEACMALLMVLIVYTMFHQWVLFTFSFEAAVAYGFGTFAGIFLLFILVMFMTIVFQFMKDDIKNHIEKYKHGYVDLG